MNFISSFHLSICQFNAPNWHRVTKSIKTKSNQTVHNWITKNLVSQFPPCKLFLCALSIGPLLSLRSLAINFIPSVSAYQMKNQYFVWTFLRIRSDRDIFLLPLQSFSFFFSFFFGTVQTRIGFSGLVEMASNIGMMDSAYFVGRNEILTWINNALQLNLSRIEEVTSRSLALR